MPHLPPPHIHHNIQNNNDKYHNNELFNCTSMAVGVVTVLFLPVAKVLSVGDSHALLLLELVAP